MTYKAFGASHRPIPNENAKEFDRTKLRSLDK